MPPPPDILSDDDDGRANFGSGSGFSVPSLDLSPRPYRISSRVSAPSIRLSGGRGKEAGDSAVRSIVSRSGLISAGLNWRVAAGGGGLLGVSGGGGARVEEEIGRDRGGTASARVSGLDETKEAGAMMMMMMVVVVVVG